MSIKLKILKNSWLGVVLLCAACQQGTLYHSFQSVNTEEWKKEDTLFFKLHAKAHDVCCRLEIELRATSDYPYKNLWLDVNDNTADSLVFLSSSLNCMLYDDKGKQEGSTAGALYQSSFFMKEIVLQANTSPIIKISQGMSDVSIKGISDVGVKLVSCVQHQPATE